MKTFKFILLSMLFCSIYTTSKAQISINVHLGTAPDWGPRGYEEARYYYLPDVQSYYDVRSSRFIYFNGVTWVHRTYLPSRYRNYDLYNGYKVVMTDYHGDRPYTNYKTHKVKYAKGYHGQVQHTIGVRPERHNTEYRNHEDKSTRNNNYNEKIKKHDNHDNHDNGKGNKHKNK